MGNTSANKAEVQKAYKIAKKKRRKIKKAEKKAQSSLTNEGTTKGSAPSSSDNHQTSSPKPSAKTNKKWHRNTTCRKAFDRPVDEVRVNELLEKRSAAKLIKNYEVSDAITRRLVDDLEIFYDDAQRQWHTRKLKKVEDSQE